MVAPATDNGQNITKTLYNELLTTIAHSSQFLGYGLNKGYNLIKFFALLALTDPLEFSAFSSPTSAEWQN